MRGPSLGILASAVLAVVLAAAATPAAAQSAAVLPPALRPPAVDPLARTVTDINMVVALDRSESVGFEDRHRQVESLAAALVDPRFVAAVKAGWHGRLGLTVMTWSSFERTHVVVPWTAIGSREDADRVVAAMRDYEAVGADAEHKPQTDISLAISAGMRLLSEAPFDATKRIINVIGDGIDNFGGDAFIDRDLALENDVTINGLVHAKGAAIPIVVRFFETQVIGGPYAFVVSAPTPDSFTSAMLRKMLMEIANATLSSRPDGSGSFRVFNNLPGRG